MVSWACSGTDCMKTLGAAQMVRKSRRGVWWVLLRCACGAQTVVTKHGVSPLPACLECALSLSLGSWLCRQHRASSTMKGASGQ